MKEQVTKFNLEAAFKALNEIEIPQVGGVKPNKDDHKELRESMRPTPKTDCLLEDYYDVNSQEELGQAQADRAEEVAQAKLAKIEKIVDLDAESPEDIQPSYVGKTIVQCPQCMTLFYRDPADIHVSDDDPTVVNVGEQCPNCNNDSGYNVIGKVAAEEQPAEMPAGAPVEENELDLNFEEPAPEEEQPTKEAPVTEEKPVDENSEEELNLEPVEEPAEESKEEEKPEEEEEKKEESFEPHSENILAEQVEKALNEETNVDELTKKLKEHDEYIKVLQDEIKAEEEAVKNAKNDFIKKMHENNLASLKDALDKAIPEEVKAEAAIEELPTAEDAAEDMTKNEALKEATADELLNDLKKDTNFSKLSDTSIKKLISIYKEDAAENGNLKKTTAKDIIEYVGDFGDFIQDWADEIDMKFARDLAKNSKKIVDACKKEYAKIFPDKQATDDESVEFIFEYSQGKDANNTITVNDAIDAIKQHLKESLKEDEEKFPDPEKHELVDTINGIEIYHCKNCGKYGAKINDKIVKKDSAEEIKDYIKDEYNNKLEEAFEDRQLRPDMKPENYGIDVTAEVKQLLAKGFDINSKVCEDEINKNDEWCSTIEVLNILKNGQKIIGIINPEAVKFFADRYEQKLINTALKNISEGLHEATEHAMSNEEVEADVEKADIENQVHEEICPKCGKDVEDPCETDKEAYKCGNNLEEDVIAKDAPEKADDIELEQCKVSEIHKGKEEHVPGAIVYESVESELATFVAGLDEGCKNCEESIENENKIAEFEQKLNNNELTEDKEVSNDEFMAMLNNPVFNEGCDKEEVLEEDHLPSSSFVDQLADDIEHAGEDFQDNLDNDIEPDELEESRINKIITNYLTEVYSNVKDFTIKECSMNKNKLFIEGTINFNSGATKNTKFEFTNIDKHIYEGINKDLASDSKFKLTFFTEDCGHILMVESLEYSYYIDKNLVEGLIK